jgi:hypothetical protein
MNSYQMVLHRPVETARDLSKFEFPAHAFANIVGKGVTFG